MSRSRAPALVFTPTYASFLNRIDCHFRPIGEFVINNADYPKLRRARQGDGNPHPLPQRTATSASSRPSAAC
jgi:hypothetical protein